MVLHNAYFLAYFFLAREYKRVPKTAIPEPIPPSKDIGVLNTMHDATMMTTRFSVLATECVTGDNLDKVKKEASL